MEYVYSPWRYAQRDGVAAMLLCCDQNRVVSAPSAKKVPAVLFRLSDTWGLGIPLVCFPAEGQPSQPRTTPQQAGYALFLDFLQS